MESNRNTESIALERYKIISPILTAMEENADNGKIGFLKSEACGLAGVSRKTLARWLNCYTQKGLDGLKYRSGSTGKKLIPSELVKEAILLRREVPTRSVPQIIEILEMEGKAPKGFLKRSTLQDRLRESGYTKAQMKLYRQPGIAARRFARLERNDMWQADIKHCGYLKPGDEETELFFVAFIDDATRYIVHGEFYHEFDQCIVEDSLRKAIIKNGLPQRLYFDNGGQFKNKWMERACAIMDIKLIFTGPYNPEAHGKIERFNRTLDSFLNEAVLKKPQSLSEMNTLFNVWLAECYHNKKHAGIDTTPEKAFVSSKKPLRFLPVDTIARAFLRHERRKVDKSGCISFKGKKYEVGVVYIGRTVDIVYDPADISVLTVEDNHLNTYFRINELIIGTYSGPRPKLPEHMSEVAPETSRLLDEKQKLYNKRQLSAVRAISYTQINKGQEEQVQGETVFSNETLKPRKGGDSNV